MGKLKEKWNAFRFKGILAITLVFTLIAAILLVELSGIRFRYAQKDLTLLPKEQIVTKVQACAKLEKDTLLLHSSQDPSSVVAYEHFDLILKDMKIGTTFVDLSLEEVPDFSDYSIVIVMLSDLSHLGEDVITLCDWVYQGGNVLFPLTLEENAYSSAIENKIGIEASFGFTEVDRIHIKEGFMLGGGSSYFVPEAYESARTVQINEKVATVHAWEEKEGGVPLIWEADYGEGCFVVDNFGMYTKAMRGFFSASLSLFKPVFLYSVINGSTFYLDDFPSQIPGGNSDYISRDYQTSIRDFYINIWWPDMMNLADKYGIRYTGLAIECYDDAVDGTTKSDPDTGTFLNFGNMLLRKGGELGYHGYNHQPLGLSHRDYKGIYDYKTWESDEAMAKAFSHLVEFCDELFPGVPMSVYVPPSNLLAEEGREMLLREFPQIKTLSGIYLPDDVLDFCLLQEYDVDENGVVDQPRIISGCDINDYMTLGALSEMNLHYVNNHFTHPDDALDPERGAELGWAELYRRFDSFLSWLYGMAPNLRNLTGTEFSAAVQRFAAVSPHIELGEDTMTVTIENFVDNAQFMLRFNEEAPDRVEGGTLTHLTGDLYLLEAVEDTVHISFQ